MGRKPRNEKKDFQILKRRDLQRLAKLRAAEAGVLARSGKKQGAYYLAGLAVECALKACIAKGIKAHEFPNKDYASKVYSHDLSELLKSAGLQKQYDDDIKANKALALNWGIVTTWTVDSRYEHSGLPGIDIYEAVTSADGVLKWIEQHW